MTSGLTPSARKRGRHGLEIGRAADQALAGQRIGQRRQRRAAIDPADRRQQRAQRKTVTADIDDAGRRSGDDDAFAHRIDLDRIAAIDKAVAADLEMRLIGALDARRKHVPRHHRAAQRKGAGFGRGEFDDRHRVVASRAARRPDRAGSAAAGRPSRAAPRQNPPRRKSARRRGRRRARAIPRSPPAAPAHARRRAPSSALRARTVRSRRGETPPPPAGSALRQRSSRRWRANASASNG